ncbi:Uncharacterised protein [uncultured archaeon]|nr:Uncharacterised protein [uncultured archaeon]
MKQKYARKGLVVKEATLGEKEWLFCNQDLFSEPYSIPPGLTDSEKYKVFVLKKGSELLGFHSFQIRGAGEGAYVDHLGTSIREGYEGQRLGRFLVGRVRERIYAKGVNKGVLQAERVRSKKFWGTIGYTPIHGTPMGVEGKTLFNINFKGLKTPPRKTSWPKALGRRKR